MKNAIVIIPARAGSKRIKKKNIKLFLKKPIINYPIKAAKKSKLFGKIIVSTDSRYIGRIGMKCGATDVIYRPKKLSNDTAGTMAVIKHAIKYLEKEKYNFEYVCCLYPVAVLIKPTDLTKSYNLILKKKTNFIFSSLKYSHPIQRGFVLKKNKIKFFGKKGPLTKRTQDISETYHDAGQFYWGRKNNWKKLHTILSNKCYHYPMPDNRAVDIDNVSDWLKAEALYSYYFKR